MLAIAMIISCISIVSFAVPTEEETVFEVNFDDKIVDPSGYVGSAPSSYDMAAVDDADHGKVMEFKTSHSWVSPCWDMGLKIKEYADKHPGKDISITLSADVKLDNAKSVALRFRKDRDNGMILDAYNMGIYFGSVENGKWVKLSKTFTVKAADTEKITGNSSFGICLDSLHQADTSKEVTARIDNIKVVTYYDKPEIVNGNAESGTAGWDTFHAVGGSSIAQVEGGANGTAHSIKFSVGNGNQWSSVAFNLGPAIMDDEANGYTGGGAGIYRIKFWAKAAEGKGGKFSFVLNSQYHKQKGEVQNDLTEEQFAEIKDYDSSTFIMNSAFTMTDQWQQYEIILPVSASFHTFIKKLYSFGKTNVYDLILRFDGSGSGKAFEKAQFDYYIDEVVIEHSSNAGIGIKTLGGNGSLYEVVKGGSDFTALKESAKDGKVKTTFRVYNLSDTVLNFQLMLQNSTNWQWLTLNGKQHIAASKVDPYSYIDIDYEFDIDENGMVTDSSNNSKISLKQVFFRMDIHAFIDGQFVCAPAGKEAVIVPLSNPEIITEMQKMEPANSGSMAVKNVYDGYALTSLNLDSGKTLDFNFYAAFASADAGEKATVNIYRGGKVVSTLNGSREAGTLRYKFTYADIAPQSMADEITAELKVNGKTVATRTESIKSYCEKVLATADADKYRTFMADMLTYGQALSDYKNLGKTIAGENDAWIATSKTDFATIKGELQSVKSATTATDTNNKIKSAGLYFYDINKIYFRAEINGGVVKINGTEVDGNNGKYYTDGIAASKFADVYTVTVTAEVNGTEVHKVTYSVNSYVLSKCDGDAAINVLARALGCYGYSATQLS